MQIGFYYDLVHGKKSELKEEKSDINIQVLAIEDFDDMNAKFYSKQHISKATGAIHKWKIKCIQFSGNDQIGIISVTNIEKIDQISEFWLDSDVLKDAYFWWTDSGIWRMGQPLDPITGKNCRLKWDQESWCCDDEIGIELNTQQWTLQFLKNDKVIYGPWKLEDVNDDTVFHPVVTFGSIESKYHNNFGSSY